MINKQDREELIQAVDNINEQIQVHLYSEKYGQDPWIWAELHIGLEGCVVIFLGECIYNSENEEREWTDEDNSGPGLETLSGYYEDIEPYLKKKIMTLIANLQKIQL